MITHLPDPELETGAHGADPIGLYIQGLVADFQEAVNRVREYGGDGYRVQAQIAQRKLRRALLDIHGEACSNPECAEGDVFLGWTPVDYYGHPPEQVTNDCPVCRGEGFQIPAALLHLLDPGLED